MYGEGDVAARGRPIELERSRCRRSQLRHGIVRRDPGWLPALGVWAALSEGEGVSDATNTETRQHPARRLAKPACPAPNVRAAPCNAHTVTGRPHSTTNSTPP